MVYLGRNGTTRPTLDYLLGDACRDLLVLLELHGVGRAALRGGAQIGRVAEHLGQRDARRNHLRVAALLLAVHVAAPAGEGADHVADELLGGHDLDRVDGPEKDSLGALCRLLEGW